MYSYQHNKRNCFYNKQNHASYKSLSELLLEAIRTMLFDGKKKKYIGKSIVFLFCVSGHVLCDKKPNCNVLHFIPSKKKNEKKNIYCYSLMFIYVVSDLISRLKLK